MLRLGDVVVRSESAVGGPKELHLCYQDNCCKQSHIASVITVRSRVPNVTEDRVQRIKCGGFLVRILEDLIVPKLASPVLQPFPTRSF